VAVDNGDVAGALVADVDKVIHSRSLRLDAAGRPQQLFD